jgi:hypothetical protein
MYENLTPSMHATCLAHYAGLIFVYKIVLCEKPLIHIFAICITCQSLIEGGEYTVYLQIPGFWIACSEHMKLLIHYHEQSAVIIH